MAARLMDYTRCAAVAAAVAAGLVVRVKSLFPWRAPPCICRGRRIYIYIISLYCIYLPFLSDLFVENGGLTVPRDG